MIYYQLLELPLSPTNISCRKSVQFTGALRYNVWTILALRKRNTFAEMTKDQKFKDMKNVQIEYKKIQFGQTVHFFPGLLFSHFLWNSRKCR